MSESDSLRLLAQKMTDAHNPLLPKLNRTDR
jgi:hypothetical protein